MSFPLAWVSEPQRAPLDRGTQVLTPVLTALLGEKSSNSFSLSASGNNE